MTRANWRPKSGRAKELTSVILRFLMSRCLSRLALSFDLPGMMIESFAFRLIHETNSSYSQGRKRSVGLFFRLWSAWCVGWSCRRRTHLSHGIVGDDVHLLSLLRLAVLESQPSVVLNARLRPV